MSRPLAQLYEEASARHEGWGLRLLSWADIVTWADTWVLAYQAAPTADPAVGTALAKKLLSRGV